MKLSVTVNLGNYENIKVESSEYETASQCEDEIRHALSRFGNEPRVLDFVSRMFN